MFKRSVLYVVLSFTLNALWCVSGQCNSSSLCDGKADCNDGSDETQEACKDFHCDDSKYRCAYGACVRGDARCDNIEDCFDRSDEANCSTTTLAPSFPIKECKLPSFPDNGEYNVSGITSFNPGDIVRQFTKIVFSCKSGYIVYPPLKKRLICVLGRWDEDVPHCKRVCPTVSSTESVKVVCEIEGKTGKNYCKDPIEPTVAKFSCQAHYKNNSETDPPAYITRCKSGQWDKPIDAEVCECGPDAFRCEVGHCINSTLLCDGEKDCSDGSDETQEVCRDNRCDNSKYKCAYGACVLGNARCNNVADCLDNSDEENCPLTTYTSFPGFDCQLPDFPEHGNYTIHGLDSFSPGDRVSWSSVIEFSCKSGYKVYPSQSTTLFCISGSWNKDIPYCKRVCSTVSSTESVKVTCEIEGNAGEIYCDDPVESTVAKFSCQTNYEKVNETDPPIYISRCENGHWDKPIHAYACKCGRDAFQCASGQCINGSLSCDGKADCSDGSDETKKACLDIQCDDSKYQCAYGACVRGTARCDNIPDCLDRSDEKNCATAPPVPSRSINGCELPGFPENGEYNVSGLAKFNPGDIVGSYTVIRFSCKTGYRAYPYENNLLVCISGTWNKGVPHCKQVCSTVSSTEAVNVTCELEDRIGEKYCKDPVESTIAIFSCQMHYEKVSETDPSPYVTRCEDGRWNKPTYNCVPACGRRRGKGKTNIIGGTAAQEHDFPWHIAIYNKTKEYLCGGSLIYYAGRLAVVTAAHCVADYHNGIHLPKDNYLVAAGKHYRQYDDERDRDSVQYLQVKSIHPYGRYKGELSQHAGDIAVIELKNEIRITSYVQPVCMNWDTHKQYTSNSGMVIGWGYTKESGDLSDVLKVLQVPILQYEECFDSVREEFKPYVTFDKLCAGYKGQGQSVCSGDSGGGLVVREGTKHYLRGIVSVSPPSQTAGYCDQDSYAGYTDLQISHYIDFLRRL